MLQLLLFNVTNGLIIGTFYVLMALGLSLIVGPSMIARLSRYQIGQVVRNDGPLTHLPKAGTPTMGGALMERAVDSFGAGAQWFADATALTQALSRALEGRGAEVRILVKGSRFNRLERVVDALTGGAGAMGGH